MTEGYNKVTRMIGAHNLSIDERQAEDYYATDPIAAEWLIKIEHLNHNIWECACGEGHLAKVFKDHGYNVRSTDLIDRGYGMGGGRFSPTKRAVLRGYNHKSTLQVCRGLYKAWVSFSRKCKQGVYAS